jgi:hypothetical protein
VGVLREGSTCALGHSTTTRPPPYSEEGGQLSRLLPSPVEAVERPHRLDQSASGESQRTRRPTVPAWEALRSARTVTCSLPWSWPTAVRGTGSDRECSRIPTRSGTWMARANPCLQTEWLGDVVVPGLGRCGPRSASCGLLGSVRVARVWPGRTTGPPAPGGSNGGSNHLQPTTDPTSASDRRGMRRLHLRPTRLWPTSVV